MPSSDMSHQIISPQLYEGAGQNEGGSNEGLGNGNSQYLHDRKVFQKR
jgi:hypothetical protein